MEKMTPFFKFDTTEGNLDERIKIRKRIFLENQKLVNKMGKTFKHNWKELKTSPDGENYTVVDKLYVTFSSDIDNFQQLTIFDMIYFMGKKRKFMDFVFGAEESKNWVEVIYASDMLPESPTAQKLATRIKFLDFMTLPLNQFVLKMEFQETIDVLENELKPLLSSFKVSWESKKSNAEQ